MAAQIAHVPEIERLGHQGAEGAVTWDKLHTGQGPQKAKSGLRNLDLDFLAGVADLAVEMIEAAHTRPHANRAESEIFDTVAGLAGVAVANAVHRWAIGLSDPPLGPIGDLLAAIGAPSPAAARRWRNRSRTSTAAPSGSRWMHTCAECGATFVSRRRDAAYCPDQINPNCRKRAQRRNRA